MAETVNHPQHYGGDTTYEVIKVIEAWELDESFCLGNVVKYVARAGKKVTEVSDREKIEDLKKAAWYLNREITKLEAMHAKGIAVQEKMAANIIIRKRRIS